jgi:hypothetical protein
MTTKAKKIGVGLKTDPVKASQAHKLSAEEQEAFGAGQIPTVSPPTETPPGKVLKAQITLHIPLDVEKRLRDGYGAQPAGHRGRFSDYVYQFLKDGIDMREKG